MKIKTLIWIAVAIVAVFILVTLGAKKSPTFGSAVGIEFGQEFNRSTTFPTKTNVQVTTSSTLVLASSTNSGRLYASITNNSTTTAVFLSIGTPAIGDQGIRLEPQGHYELTSDKNPFFQAINGIASSTVSVSTLDKTY